jgi:ribosomal protein S18 acetylase RimI-like enzyme
MNYRVDTSRLRSSQCGRPSAGGSSSVLSPQRDSEQGQMRLKADDRLTFRGFQDRVDFEAIAQIRNEAARKHRGDDMTPIDASSIERVISAPDRLRIARVNRDPVGFTFVAREGVLQLDEFGTVEGTSWLFVGPTCVPNWEGKGVEKALLDSLTAYARETGIPRLIKFARTSRVPEYLNEMLVEAGFRERLRYLHMRLKMTAPPPAPGELPDGLELIHFAGAQDFDLLWSVLEAAFDYLERDADSYEQQKATFGSMASAYFPICLESVSSKPVGTIALIPGGEHGQIATFGVIPSFQRRGIGSLLMAQAIDHAWRSGVRTIDLAVRVENPQAISIYRRFGFKNEPERTTIVLLKDL